MDKVSVVINTCCFKLLTYSYLGDFEMIILELIGICQTSRERDTHTHTQNRTISTIYIR